MRHPKRALPSFGALCLCLGLAACGDSSDNDGDNNSNNGDNGGNNAQEAPLTLVDEAKARVPDMLTLHTTVFKRTCSPNDAVCHNTKEYPDLHTPANMLDAIGKPCNFSEEPEDIFDGCEPQADLLVFTSGPKSGLEARIAWHEFRDDDWVLTLEEPLEGCEAHRASFRLVNGAQEDDVILDAPGGGLIVGCDGREVRVPDVALYGPAVVDGLQRRVHMGDANRNGAFGFDQGTAQIVPGSPTESYMVARMLGTVPGTKMPLANQPLDDVEYLALFCWIETLDDDPDERDPIRYDDCPTAQRVLDTGRLDLPAPLAQE